VDPSSAVLKVALSRDPRAVRAFGEDLPILDASFRGVFIITTLCFLDNPVRALRGARRALTPSGRLVAGFVPADSAWRLIYRGLAEQGYKFYKYAKFYAVSQVEGLLGETGFKLELYVSTLIKNKPGAPEALEEPVLGLQPGAGFVVIRAIKTELYWRVGNMYAVLKRQLKANLASQRLPTAGCSSGVSITKEQSQLAPCV